MPILTDLFESEIERIPAQLRPFVVRRSTPSFDEQSWNYFAYGYARAFEELTNEALARPSRDYLRLPLFYLCRHSLELAMKYAIAECSNYTHQTPKLEGHALLTLWRFLLEQIALVGYPVDDEWTAYCGKLVEHLHDADPSGERFRYPASIKGSVFDAMNVDVEGLAKAHFHVSMYCDAVTSMLHELNPDSRFDF